MSTGLFKTARPAAETPSSDEAPEFSISFTDEGKAKLLVIPPLGRVKFIVEPRSIPSINELSVRVDSSLMDATVDAEKLKSAALMVVSEAKSGVSPLVALLRAKQRFAEAIPDAIVASTFNGFETGSIEVIVKRVKATDLPFESGFESTAEGGEGWGIEPFRPQRPLTKLSNKMFLSTSTLEALRKDARGGIAPSPAAGSGSGSEEGSGVKESSLEPRSWTRAWTDQEMKEAKRTDPPENQFADTIKDVLVFLYAKFQYEAGRKTGIERGAAWQAALEAATEVGAQLFILSGD